MTTCPACGYQTLSESFYGSYEICAVCGWEDDGVQFASPASGGGANGESLVLAQLAALRERRVDGEPETGFRLDPAWRPLTVLEIAEAHIESKASCWGRGSIHKTTDAYWLRPEKAGPGWLEPWVGLDEKTASTLEKELTREVGTDHRLSGLVCGALARREDSDDVLFQLGGVGGAVAVVHLTWTSRPPEQAPSPETGVYAQLSDWIEYGMLEDSPARHRGRCLTQRC